MNILKTIGSLFWKLLPVILILFTACSGEPVEKPTLYIIGDSTVKNGQGDGRDGLWGWGNTLPELFDTTRITIENHAIGGRSSRTFQTEGRWQKILDEITPGDFVLMQFGHNDGSSLNTGRARGTLKGTGEETMEVVMERDSSLEVVHTYGWYMRKYIKDAKEAGGIPIVLSPVPRNMWDEAGNVLRASGDYGKWASDVAAEENAYFIDLNGIIAVKYEVLGEEEVTRRYFLTDHTHTNLVGARVNAAAVVEGLRMIPDCPLNKYLTE